MKRKKTNSMVAIAVAVLVFIVGGVFLASNPNLFTQVLFTPDLNLQIEMDGQQRAYSIEDYQEPSAQAPGFAYVYSGFEDEVSGPTAITISDFSSSAFYYGIAFEPLSEGLEAEVFDNGVTVYADPLFGPVHFFVAMNQFRVEDDQLNQEIILELEFLPITTLVSDEAPFDQPELPFVEEEVTGVIEFDDPENIEDVISELEEQEPQQEIDPRAIQLREDIYDLTGVLLDVELIQSAIRKASEFLVLTEEYLFDFEYFYTDFLTQHPPLDDEQVLKDLAQQEFSSAGEDGISSLLIESFATELREGYGYDISQEVINNSLASTEDVIDSQDTDEIIDWISIIDEIEAEKPMSDEELFNLWGIFLSVFLILDQKDVSVSPDDNLILGGVEFTGEELFPDEENNEEAEEVIPSGTDVLVIPDEADSIDGVGEEDRVGPVVELPESTFGAADTIDEIPESSFDTADAVEEVSESCEVVPDAEAALAEIERLATSSSFSLEDLERLVGQVDENLGLLYAEQVEGFEQDDAAVVEEIEQQARESYDVSQAIQDIYDAASSKKIDLSSYLILFEETVDGTPGADRALDTCLGYLKEFDLEGDEHIRTIEDALIRAGQLAGGALDKEEEARAFLAAAEIAAGVEESINDEDFKKALADIINLGPDESDRIAELLGLSLSDAFSKDEIVDTLIGPKGLPGRDGIAGASGTDGSDATCKECDCECDEERIADLEERIQRLESALEQAEIFPAAADTGIPTISEEEFLEILEKPGIEEQLIEIFGFPPEGFESKIKNLEEKIVEIETAPLHSAVTDDTQLNINLDDLKPKLIDFMETPEFSDQFIQVLPGILNGGGGNIFITYIQNFFGGGGTPIPGISGVNCWDTNGDYNSTPEEDLNGDGEYNALDCQGQPGEKGEKGDKGEPGEAGQDGQNGSCSENQCQQAAQSAVGDNVEALAESAAERVINNRVPVLIDNAIDNIETSNTPSTSSRPSASNTNVERDLAAANRAAAPREVADTPADCELDFADMSGLSEEERKTLYFMKCILGFIRGSQQPDGKTYAYPNDELNREHIAQMGFRYRGTEAENFALAQQLPARFSDVPQNVWYYPAAQIADYYNYMTGVGNGETFEAGRPANVLEILRTLATFVGGDYPQVNDIYQRWQNTEDVEWYRAAYNAYTEVVGEPPVDLSNPEALSKTSLTRMQFFTLLRTFYEAANPSLATRLASEYNG